MRAGCKVLALSVVVCWQPYIQYMRFARRAEGIKAARAVFKMAREDTRTTYQLYVAAALMEYYCSKVTNITLLCLVSKVECIIIIFESAMNSDIMADVHSLTPDGLSNSNLNDRSCRWLAN